MATQKGKLHISLIDDVGVRAATELFITLDDTKTVAQFIADVNALGATIAPLVEGGWVRWEASVLPALPTGALTTPTPDADAEEVGEWSFPQTGSTYIYTIPLPTLIDSAILGSHINQANTAVTTFQTAMITPQANGTSIVSREGRALLAVRQTFLGNRKHRRSLHQKSLDVVNP